MKKTSIKPQAIWPDLYVRNNFFQRDDDRCSIVAILIALLLIASLLAISFHAGRSMPVETESSVVEVGE